MEEGWGAEAENMSSGESMDVRFDQIDAMLTDPKSEINTDCLLVSSLAQLAGRTDPGGHTNPGHTNPGLRSGWRNARRCASPRYDA